MSNKIAALFSGQGSQYPGMGKALVGNYPEAARVYELGADILGYDIAALSFEGAEAELNRTLHSQPAIFTLSMAAYEAAKTRMPPITAVAGHSLGEFAALCCAGAYSLEDGFRLIKARAAAMNDAAALTPGAMVAVIGSDEAAIKSACEETEGFVVPVNFNLPGQTVISGEEAAVAAAAEALAAGGARTVKLAVSSAFHTKLMQPAADRFRVDIAGVAFREPCVDFYSNLTGGRFVPGDLADYFARHMVSPVRFVELVNAMAADGIDCCVEFGPGRSASTLAKKNARALTVFSVDSPETMEKLKF